MRKEKLGPLHDVDHLRLWLKKYYEILNNDQNFVSELNALFCLSRKYPSFRDDPLTPSEEQLQEHLRKCGLPVEEKSYPHPDLEMAFENFGKKWRLPERCWIVTRGGADLWHSLRLWRSNVNLQPAKLSVSGIIHQVFVMPKSITLERRDFIYDPTKSSYHDARGELERLLQEVRREALEQINEHYQAALRSGWPELAVKHRNPEERRVLAVRVYRRAVVGMTWSEIARLDHKDVRSVMDSTMRLATFIGVPLPKQKGRRRRGRQIPPTARK